MRDALVDDRRPRVACLLATGVRGELAMLIPVYALAALFLLMTSAPFKRRRRVVVARRLGRCIVLAIGAIIVFSASSARYSQTWLISTGYYRHRMIVYGLWAGGAFTIGSGSCRFSRSRRSCARKRRAVGRGSCESFVAVTSAGGDRVRLLHGGEGGVPLDGVLDAWSRSAT